jgi:hypothetical protein
MDLTILNDDVVLSYIAPKGKLIPQRCLESVLKSHGFYTYVVNRYDNNSLSIKDKEYLRESLYRLENHIEIPPVCKTCGQSLKFHNNSYSKYCSRKCSNNDNEVREKIQKSCSKSLLNIYKFKGDEIKEKRLNTLSEKYGEKLQSSSPFSVKEIQKQAKKVIKERYGTEYITKIPEIVKKIKKTCLERYGAENITQTNDYAKYHHKRVEYNGLTFDSGWEVIVYQYCINHNLNFEYQPNIQFKYYYKGKEKIYQPDFLIEGKLYEVKGDQFFEGDKMINPYDRTMDDIYELKHQCMLDNNVVILRKVDIEKIKTGLNKI